LWGSDLSARLETFVEEEEVQSLRVNTAAIVRSRELSGTSWPDDIDLLPADRQPVERLTAALHGFLKRSSSLVIHEIGP
jgi:hypothetical protein